MPIAVRIASLRDLPERELFDQATAALTVLSSRFSQETLTQRAVDAFYATNRALRDLEQIESLRLDQGTEP